MTHPALSGMFHTGLIVFDLETAMRNMSEAFGFVWAKPIVSGGEIHVLGGGTSYRESRVTYSLEGPHHIELIEQIDNTAWKNATGGPMIHHLGFSVQNLAAEVARLEALGYRMEFSGMGDSKSASRVSYLHDYNGGLWIELVDATLHQEIDEWINSGEPPGFASDR